MRKLLIIGEHPDNHSGFSRLTGSLSSIAAKSKLFEEVTAIGTSTSVTIESKPRQDYVLIDSKQYYRISEMEGENVYGRVSLGVFLAKMNYTDVLLIGDPWIASHLIELKPLFPTVSFHFYCPVEGEILPSRVKHHIPNIEGHNPNVDLKKALLQMDTVIGYSENGAKAITELIGKHTKFAYHAVERSTETPVPFRSFMRSEYETKLKDKFIVGVLGRNAHRKGIDIILQVAAGIAYADNYKKIYFLMHVPKEDVMGFDIDEICYQLDIIYKQKRGVIINTRERIIMVEDIDPMAFVQQKENTYIKDIKHGISDAQLEFFYSKINLLLNLSRGEGFGFPIIEAMVRGIPVMVNNFATPAEIVRKTCPEPDNSDLIVNLGAGEFMGSGNNLLVGVADSDDCTEKILDLSSDSSLLEEHAHRQKAFAEKECLIGNNSMLEGIPSLLNPSTPKKPKVIMLTSHMEKCGIKTYTDNLCKNQYNVSIIGTKAIKLLGEILPHLKNQTLHVQFEPNLWNVQNLVTTLSKFKNGQGNKLVMTIHTLGTATETMLRSLDGICDLFHFHAKSPIIDNMIAKSKVLISTHPIPDKTYNRITTDSIRAKHNIDPKDIVIGLSGFVLPYKKMAEQAASILKFMKDNPDSPYKLMIVGSQHEQDVMDNGKAIINSIINLAESLGIGNRLITKYGFLSAEEMQQQLSIMDYNVFYHNNPGAGAQSGSIRELIAARVIPIIWRSNFADMHNDLIEAKVAIGLSINATDPSKIIAAGDFANSAMSTLEQVRARPDFDKLREAAISNMDEYSTKYSFSNLYKEFESVYNLAQPS